MTTSKRDVISSSDDEFPITFSFQILWPEYIETVFRSGNDKMGDTRMPFRAGESHLSHVLEHQLGREVISPFDYRGRFPLSRWFDRQIPNADCVVVGSRHVHRRVMR